MKGVSDPVQTRSHYTLKKLLDATEALLNENSWLEISISDIVKAADTSVGSFYARFQDKDTLLRYLSARLTNETAESIQKFIRNNPSVSLEQTLRAVVRYLVDVHKARAGLIRTLTVLPRSYRKRSFFDDGMRNAKAFQNLVQQLVRHGISESKASFVLFVIVNAVRERFLFAEHSKPLTSFSQRKFIEELCVLGNSYLSETR